MTQAATISLYQPLLQSIALKMVGSLQDAEDIVQDTFLRWLTIDHEKINNTRAYLIRSVTNNCINHINSLKQKKKEYLDSGKLPELFEKLDFSHLDLKHELKAALDILHKKLGPLEKAIFVLREGFDFEYEELQEIFDKKKEHCRQLFCRAKEKLSREAPKISFSMETPQHFFQVVRNACSSGQVHDLLDHLKTAKKES